MAIAGHVMLHHKVYQNQLILITDPDKKLGFFYAIQLNRHLRKKLKEKTKDKNATATT